MLAASTCGSAELETRLALSDAARHVLDREKPNRVRHNALDIRPSGRRRGMTECSRVVLRPGKAGRRADDEDRAGECSAMPR